MSMQVPQGAQKQTYVATRNFGLPGNPPLQIRQGTVLLFDGFNVEFEGMPPRQIPQFRGAIQVGWVVPQEQYDPHAAPARPVSAGMQLRPADGGNPMEAKPRVPIVTAQEEERHVGNVAQHAAQVRQGNQQNYRNIPIEPQDGVPVRQLSNPDGRKNPVDMSRDASAAIRQAESTKVQPGQGRTREEIMAQMDPQQRAAYEAEIQARKAMHGVLDEQQAVPQQVIMGPETQGTVVGQVPSSAGRSESEGITSTQSVGGGVDTVDLGGTGGQQETRTVVREGITFQETNGPKENRPAPASPAQPVDLNGDPRRVIARSICPDFPDIYDFEASARKKIARIQADFEDRPDIIRAVAAAETDADVKAKLVQEFPDAFTG